MSVDDTKPSKNSRAWDLAAGLPSVALCSFGAIGFSIKIYVQLPVALTPENWIEIVAEFMATLFLLQQAFLILIRRLPSLKSRGIMPRLWAVLGTNSSFCMLLLPHAPGTTFSSLASSILLLIGTATSIYVLAHLGRAFAIFPQARHFVATGPYRVVRHPLYLSEQISVFGASFLYIQPWAVLIAIGGFLLQLPRFFFEERVMADAFPEYRAYCANTPRIIPFSRLRGMGSGNAEATDTIRTGWYHALVNTIRRVAHFFPQ